MTARDDHRPVDLESVPPEEDVSETGAAGRVHVDPVEEQNRSDPALRGQAEGGDDREDS